MCCMDLRSDSSICCSCLVITTSAILLSARYFETKYVKHWISGLPDKTIAILTIFSGKIDIMFNAFKTMLRL